MKQEEIVIEEIVIKETLLKSHLRGLLRLFPAGQYKVTISDNIGTLLEATNHESNKSDIEEMFDGFGNEIVIQRVKKVI